MRTRLTFENGSLNPHRHRVGLFWDVSDLGDDAVPVLWAVIERCLYGWHHTIDIDCEPSFRIRDRDGNDRHLTPGCRNAASGTLIEAGAAAAWANFTLHQAVARPDLRLVICRNRRPMVTLPLASAGSQPLPVPERLVFQLQCRAEPGERVGDRQGTAFPVRGVSALTVRLRGGAPGPHSTPLTFISYRAEP